MSTAKQQAVKDIMQLCDALRNVADKFETVDSSITANGFKTNGSDPITLADLSGINLTEAELAEAFMVVRDYNSLMNGGALTPTDLKTKLDKLMYWNANR